MLLCFKLYALSVILLFCWSGNKPNALPLLGKTFLKGLTGESALFLYPSVVASAALAIFC